MANIKDVAKQSGVSIATVSNYINNKKKVGEDTAARIDAAIRNLNYVVHNSGRELRMQKNNDIGIDTKSRHNVSPLQIHIFSRSDCDLQN